MADKFWEFDCEGELACPNACSAELSIGGS